MSPLEAEQLVANIFGKVDINQSGQIDFTEFVMAAMETKKLLSRDKIEAAFKAFDKDGSGSISMEELRQIFGGRVDEEVLHEIVKEADKDSNGEIDLQEFIDILIKY